jgi:carbon storage regulator
MLVLSRKKGEAINIADGVTIVVREITGSRVVLGFEAPSDVRIMRQELPHRASIPAARGEIRAEHEAGAAAV